LKAPAAIIAPLIAALLSLASGTFARAADGASSAPLPIRGPWKPDRPLAKAYDDVAKAMAMVDDNPLIRWEYRVWCVTGYRHPDEAGTGQVVDQLPDPTKDLMSPNGFFYNTLGMKRIMPPGGVRFMDNAWYFGTDHVGAVVVKTADGLLMFDTLTTPEDMQTQVLDQMPAAGLDPADFKYIFLGHQHQDHIGGANLIRQRYAPGVKFVMAEPDAKAVAAMRAAVMDGTAKRRGPAPATPEQAEAEKAARLLALPDKIDIEVPAAAAVKVGAMRVRVGPSTEVVAILDPGHTVGQMSAIVPVTKDGKQHKLFVFSGNDEPTEAAQYAISIDFARGVAEAEGADAWINTHAYQSALFYHLRELQKNPDAPNRLLMGKDGVSRYLGIFASCQRAVKQRLEDGTWQAW
jgi:glyoxylase-like metal-dependent hydrolase (beta-lactamase superfamily II)